MLLEKSKLNRRIEKEGPGPTHGNPLYRRSASVADFPFSRTAGPQTVRRSQTQLQLNSGTWNTLREKRGFKPDQARSALGLAGEGRQPMLPLRYRQLALSAYESKEKLTEGQLARKLRTDRVSARLELESLRLMIDDAGTDSGHGFEPVEMDVSEMVPA